MLSLRERASFGTFGPGLCGAHAEKSEREILPTLGVSIATFSVVVLFA